MPDPKLGKSKESRDMHYSVGALIRKDDKFLLIDRAYPPYGFAGIAGHIDKGENKFKALIREVKEEANLTVRDYKLLFEEELNWNFCSKGIRVHYWYLFECEVSGIPKRNERETKSMNWYSTKEIRKLKLESVWDYWLKKLKLI